MSVGVPHDIKKLTTSFEYNNFDKLEKILKKNPKKYAAVIMEPVYNIEPKKNFLKKVRSITKKYGCLLIFDEIVTGFRINLRGAQHHYKITPDISCFGKAMANGMPISAIVGKRKFMKHFDKIFFSTTFGGETLSLVSALETIKILKNKNVINEIKKFSKKFVKDIKKIIFKYELSEILKIEGVWWRPAFGVLREEDRNYLTLLRKNLIKNKILIGNSFNFCFSHTEKKIYKNIINKVEKALKDTKENKKFNKKERVNFVVRS